MPPSDARQARARLTPADNHSSELLGCKVLQSMAFCNHKVIRVPPGFRPCRPVDWDQAGRLGEHEAVAVVEVRDFAWHELVAANGFRLELNRPWIVKIVPAKLPSFSPLEPS